MATKTLAAAVGAQAYTNGSWIEYSTTRAAYCGTNASRIHTYILQFTTPEFVGASEYIEFGIGAGSGTYPTVRLRYAVCASDENRDLYVETNNAVEDPNQLTAGTCAFTGLTSAVSTQKVQVPTTKLKANTTYYLFLWGYTEKSSPEWCSIYQTSYHTATLGYNSGLAHISDGTADKLYQAHIFDGTEYKLYIPHIFDGTNWNICT